MLTITSVKDVSRAAVVRMDVQAVVPKSIIGDVIGSVVSSPNVRGRPSKVSTKGAKAEIDVGSDAIVVIFALVVRVMAAMSVLRRRSLAGRSAMGRVPLLRRHHFVESAISHRAVLSVQAASENKPDGGNHDPQDGNFSSHDKTHTGQNQEQLQANSIAIQTLWTIDWAGTSTASHPNC